MSPEALRNFPVVIEIPVAWGEMDAMQHVNNAAYFRYIESARMAYFERIGFLEHMRDTGIGPILAWTSCRFRRALTYPDTVSVGTRVTKIDTDRFTMETIIISHSMSDVAAESEGTVVTFDYRDQKKVPVPVAIRGRIEALERPT
ncbi:MAG: acyl-CoA thioesterase [Planctomycetes bacterium]|nr:acyl-CoA thioesterase [Planctomycetota bacterium]